VKLKSSRNVDSTTTSEDMLEPIDCGDQIVHDTVGLLDIPKGETIENAFYRGLEKILSFMEGKEFGHIYFVTKSCYEKDYGRVLEQVKFLRRIVNPLIPWSAVINCYNGKCPSTEAPNKRPEFQKLLKELIDHTIEVWGEHVDPTLFPSPKTAYSLNLPTDWRELIRAWNIDELRRRVTDEAVSSCQAHLQAYTDASEAISSYTCTTPACQMVQCEWKCSDPLCDLPLCASSSDCLRTTVTTDKELLGLSSTKSETTALDESCLRALTACNSERADKCILLSQEATACREAASSNCRKHQANLEACQDNRAKVCLREEEEMDRRLRGVMSEHEDYVKDCQNFYTAM
jgi:hypothetical protein